jgi:hypothetical protein
MKLLDILVKFKVEVFCLFFTGEQTIGVHEPVLPFLVGVDVACTTRSTEGHVPEKGRTAVDSFYFY